MKSIDAILDYYDRGQVTRLEAVAALARLVTPDNVAEVMASLPEDWMKELRRWALTTPAQGGVILGANLTDAAAKKLAEQHCRAVQVIRDWLASEGKIQLTHASNA